MLNLIKNPLVSTNALYKEINSQGYPISYHQVVHIIDELQHSGVLRRTRTIEDPIVPGSTRLETEVVGRYNPNTLGLVRHDVIFLGFQDSSDLERFARICDRHPYTHYRTFYLDQGMNAYVQFDIPLDGRGTMNEFYKIITSEFSLAGHFLVEEKRFSQSALNLSRWDPRDNWTQESVTQDLLEESWVNIKVEDPYRETPRKINVGKIDELDLYLIRELTINGKVRPKDLAPYYNRDASSISRRLQKLKQRIVPKMVLEYDRSKFDVTVALLIRGIVTNPKDISRLHLMVENHAMPFRSYLRSDEKRFIHLVWLPPSCTGEYTYFLWKKFKDLTFSSLHLHGNFSWIYPFYNLNYENRQWRIGREYLIDLPLA